jgi:hypothetical protein
MDIKISGYVKDVKMKEEGVSETQIIECYNNPEYKQINGFDAETYAREYGDKILVVCVKDGSVMDVIFSKYPNKLSFYKDNLDLDLYQIAFTATGDEAIYDSGVYGKVNYGEPGNPRKE